MLIQHREHRRAAAEVLGVAARLALSGFGVFVRVLHARGLVLGRGGGGDRVTRAENGEGLRCRLARCARCRAIISRIRSIQLTCRIADIIRLRAMTPAQLRQRILLQMVMPLLLVTRLILARRLFHIRPFRPRTVISHLSPILTAQLRRLFPAVQMVVAPTRPTMC